MWLTMLIVVALALMVCGGVYIVLRVPRFNWVQKITTNKTKARIGAVVVLLLIFGIAALATGLVNAVMIFLHLVIIWMLCDLIGRLINKLCQRERGEKYIAGGAAIILTVLIIVSGYFCCYHVFRKQYDLTTAKNIGAEKLRIVGWGDSHLGNTVNADNFGEIIERINAEEPDIVVIVGDYIDDDSPKKDMEKCTAMLKNLKTKHGVYFIFGNHDVGYYNAEHKGYGGEELIAALKAANVKVLSDDVVKITDHITLIGRQDVKNVDRKSIVELMKGVDPADYVIDLNHRPDDYDNEAAAGVDLVLSGHTHGGQFAPETFFRTGSLVPVNDRNYGHERRGKTDFIVTSGLSDWNIKFKTGTISEYFVVDIQSK